MHANAESHLGTYLYLFSALLQLLALEVWHEIVLMAMMILLVCFSSQCFVCENDLHSSEIFCGFFLLVWFC